MELDGIPLWRDNGNSHVSVRQVVDDFAQYLYLPRMRTAAILVAAVHDGIALLTPDQDSFGYADSYDEAAKRCRGLVLARAVNLGSGIPDGVLVRWDVAEAQNDAETSRQSPKRPEAPTDLFDDGDRSEREVDVKPPSKALPTRYHGSVKLDPARVGRDASRIAEEVISHLSGLVDADVQVTLEIAAAVPSGASDDIVRIVIQNGRDLKFETQGFEE